MAVKNKQFITKITYSLNYNKEGPFHNLSVYRMVLETILDAWNVHTGMELRPTYIICNQFKSSIGRK